MRIHQALAGAEFALAACATAPVHNGTNAASRSGVIPGSADGNIHKNTNGWAQDLDREIRAELQRP
jgi:hypothetical protein